MVDKYHLIEFLSTIFSNKIQLMIFVGKKLAINCILKKKFHCLFVSTQGGDQGEIRRKIREGNVRFTIRSREQIFQRNLL